MNISFALIRSNFRARRNLRKKKSQHILIQLWSCSVSMYSKDNQEWSTISPEQKSIIMSLGNKVPLVLQRLLELGQGLLLLGSQVS